MDGWMDGFLPIDIQHDCVRVVVVLYFIHVGYYVCMCNPAYLLPEINKGILCSVQKIMTL